MAQRPGILFTVFEPSGDEHAAAVIAELKRILPDVPIHALGGPRMAEAGATLIERTSGMGLMFSDSAAHVVSHFKRVGRVAKWLKDNPIAVHVPTDSPAANWSFCRMVKRKYGKPREDRPAARVVHLVAPQVWAWAQWRVRRLRKWSDRVLCLLPFEPAWFEQRGVAAQFIGHPAFDIPLISDELNWQAMHFPGGQPKVALLPGSRPSELNANWPVVSRAFARLTQLYPNAQAMVAAVNDSAAERIRHLSAGKWPDNMKLAVAQTEAVLHWSDVVLTVSGTATLHVARHGKPMTIIYKANPLSWYLVGLWLLDTRTFTLPNLIALGRPEQTRRGHIVREFVPFWGDVEPIVQELRSLLEDKQKRGDQVQALRQVVGQFTSHHAGREAAAAIAEEYHKSAG